MIRLIQIADKDGDMQATAQELEDAREELANSDAQTTHAELPEVPQQLIDVDYDSPQPPYPDFVGPATPGDATQRQRPTARAKAALARAAVAGRRERTVLVMGHGASHDYVTEAGDNFSIHHGGQAAFTCKRSMAPSFAPWSAPTGRRGARQHLAIGVGHIADDEEGLKFRAWG
eukprot:g23272.t1